MRYPASRVGGPAVSGDTYTVLATATAAKQVQVSRLARGMHGRIGVAQRRGRMGYLVVAIMLWLRLQSES